MRSEQIRLNHEENNMKEKIKDNTTKIRDNKQLPYLVAKIVEVSTRLQAIRTCCTSLLTVRFPLDPGHGRGDR
jgi:ATP-dependent 26S proteasome regulatory subunit